MEPIVTPDERADQFIQLLATHERRLAAYVATLIPSSQDADDVLQETKMWLWRSFDQYEPGTQFGAWARQVAFYRIQQYFRKRSTEKKRLVFSDACLEQLAATLDQRADQLEERIGRLSLCLARLSPDHLRILTLRYREEMDIDELAHRVGRSTTAAYRVLSRIRLALRDCVLGPQREASLSEVSP